MNAIVEALGFEVNKSVGMNLDTDENAMRTYLETASVSLASVRRHNPEVDIILCTNVEVPDDVAGILRGIGVQVLSQPFDSFRFEDDVPWHLAFYKLCALEGVLGLKRYDAVCLLDTDVWVKGKLDEMFNQSLSDNSILMIDLHALPSSQSVAAMNKTALQLGYVSGGQAWGGELLCGSAEKLESYLEKCREVFNRMNEMGIFTERGDEFLHYCVGGASPANAYAARIWTGSYFTPCRHENYVVLHLPSEKNYAFPKAYRRLRRGCLVEDKVFLRWCGLRPSRRPISIGWMLSRAVSKLVHTKSAKRY